MSKGPHWSDAELLRLRDLAPTQSERQIAATLCRSRSSVHRKLEALGLVAKTARVPAGVDLKTQIESLYDDGERPVDLPGLTGASRFYVEYVLSLHRATGADHHPGGNHIKHLRGISDASSGRGFPYCVARAA